MYTVQDFKTKKAMKEAVDRWVKRTERAKEPAAPGTVGAVLEYKLARVPIRPVRVFQPGAECRGQDPFAVPNGRYCVEGPHYPKPHTWYASVKVEDGVIVKVYK